MVQKTYFKTKDYCKVKFTVSAENSETIEILGLNSDWQNSIVMSKKKDGSFSSEVSLPKGSQHQFKYKVNATEWQTSQKQTASRPTNLVAATALLSSNFLSFYKFSQQ